MLYFATYFDFNYLPRALVMINSLRSTTSSFTLFVLCLDKKTEEYFAADAQSEIITISLEEIEKEEAVRIAKSNRSKVEYIFTLSPVLPLFILENYNHVDFITSLDADLCFYSDPSILFNSAKSIYISPHRFSEANKVSEKYGKFNVSFQSFKRDEDGLACLKDWKQDCLAWCKDKLEDGKYADQKYLDKWVDKYKNVEVISNKGACVASWNLDISPISRINDTYYIQNDKLIFYHFHGVRKNKFNMYKLSIYDYCKNIYRYEKRLYIDYITRLNLMQKNLKTVEIKRSSSKFPLLSDYYLFQLFNKIFVIKIINIFYPKSIFHKK